MSKIKNNAIINSIIYLLSEYSKLSEEDKRSIKYLLNQSIREYTIDEGHKHISKAANELWMKLKGSESILKYKYRDPVKCDKLTKTIEYESYKGAEKNGAPKSLTPNCIVIFNKIFHEDHIVPVSFILNKLLELKKIDFDSVKELLDKMHVCILLKEEDRGIGRTKGRHSLDYKDIVDSIYNNNKPKPIELFR